MAAERGPVLQIRNGFSALDRAHAGLIQQPVMSLVRARQSQT